MDSEKLHRLAYTAVGFAAHHLDEMRVKTPPPKQQSTHSEGPHILFTFWDAPSYERSKVLLDELQGKFAGNGLDIGAALFVRHMGNVGREPKYEYDKNHIWGFCNAAVDTGTKVFFITSGTHWTEVVAQPSPLLRMLEGEDDNLMKYDDGTRIPRVLQPPSNYLPKPLRGMFGTDRNGVLYLSHHSPEVETYDERNLRLLAESVKVFANLHPELYLGISIKNEVDYPGHWITRGKKLEDEDLDRVEVVKGVLAKNVEIFRDVGLTNIYTNQSVEDAENRGSPLSTAFIEGANVGITTWRTGNINTYHQAAELAMEHSVDWALPICNPLAFTLDANLFELVSAVHLNPKFIGVYNWWPHFTGYGVRGMALEQALRNLTR